MSSELRVNKLTSRSGVGTVTFNDSGLIITGIATAATLDITGNATIAGVLSYDDVTNVDSVGIITARSGLRVVGAASSIGVGIANPAEKIDVAGSIQSDTGLKVAGHPVVGYGNLGGGEYAARLGSTGSSTLNKTQIYARGALVATFDGASGEVGIGTDNPAHKLDVLGTSVVANIKSTNNNYALQIAGNNCPYDVYVGSDDSNNFLLANENNDGTFTERLRVKSDGDVYIGNIAHSNDGGANSSYRTLTLTDTTNGAQLHLRGQSPKLFLDVTSGGNGEIYYDSGDLRILSGEPGTTSSEKVRITSAGNFGIGVTPNVKLHVKLDTDKHLYFQGNIGEIGNVPGIQGVTDSGSLASLGLRGNDLRFATGSAERMRIDTSGRLLVGTSTARTDFYSGALSADIQIEDSSYCAYSAYVTNGNAAFIFGRGNPISGSIVGNLSWMADDGTDEVEAARISAQIDGTPGSNDMPGRLVFSTTADGANSVTERMRIHSSGEITKNSQPRFIAKLSANTSYNPYNFGNYIDFDSVEYDIGGNFTTTGANKGLFTAPVAGLYQFTAAAYCVGQALTQSWFVVNGSRKAYTDWVLSSTSDFAQNSQGIYLSAGDTVGFHPHRGVNSSFTVNASVHHTWFSGYLVG